VKKLVIFFFVISGVLIIKSCSKKNDSGNNPPDPCAGVTIVVSGTVTNSSTAGATDGAISATATGGSGFTFSVNNGPFQSSGTFSGLTAGTYSITAKNSNNCTATKQFTVTTGNLCAGITININATTASNSPCQAPNGSISATATGSTGFTYSIDGTYYQATGDFNNLASGTYTVSAKDVNGCSASKNVTIANTSAGPLFTAVRTLLQNNCVSCHNNTQSEGGMNWSVDCNIINNQDRVKARAVDNNPSSMPPTGPLSQSDKNKITDWINAGGRYSD
jgi:hypothetical protein